MKLKGFLKFYYPAFIVLLILTAFSLYAYHETNSAISSRRLKLFEFRVQQVTEATNNRIRDYVQILRGCQALFYASNAVTREDWKEYTNNLMISSNYPGFQAIAYCAFIPVGEKAALEGEIRRMGYPDFKIKSSFEHDYLAPIIFIEPFSDRNLRAFGFDMYDEANRRNAIDRAVQTGEATLTRKVKLVQETNEDVQPGFLLYLPVYSHPDLAKTEQERKKNVKGLVYHPFRAHDLMTTLLEDFQDINIEIYDGTDLSPENLLYSSSPGIKVNKGSDGYKPEFASDTTIAIAETEWNFVVSTREHFGSSIERQQPVLVLVFGIALSILLFIMALIFIKRRTEVIKELNVAKELEHKKDEFIGIASHELKTPLTSVKAYMQFLERSDLKDRDRVFLQKANAQIKKLSNLISDLLDVSKIQAGRLQLKVSSFQLHELVNDSVESVRHMYSSHDIESSSSIPSVTMNGDKFRLEQALTNFLINAVKYSPGAKKVYINAKLVNNMVKIEVEDHGIGISKENQEKMFEKFFRADELSPSLSGLGMGLYISNEIIKMHSGEVEVRSELGKGSVFGIMLPISDIHYN